VIIGIHPDKEWGSYSDKWIGFLQQRGIGIKILDLLKDDFTDQVKGCDGVMWRWLHIQRDKQSAQRILYVIENYLKIPVFPNTHTSWHFDEKIAQWYLLKALNAPLPDTWVFWEYDAARSWARTACYPAVFKLSVGAGASNVLKVENETEAVRLVDRMFRDGVFPMTMNEYAHARQDGLRTLLTRAVDAAAYLFRNEYPPLASMIPWWKPELEYALFQEFLPDNAFDTRVTVIGNRAFAFRRINRPNDFRASGSGNLDYDPGKIDPRCLEIAFDVSRRAGFQAMAYDFLYKGSAPVICEISYTFVDEAVYACPGHWDSALAWHDGQLWPEEAQVMDFARSIGQRQPGRS
jgi:glutathione synthase/RimK-type ligase-like ATP-grasp enzyme